MYSFLLDKDISEETISPCYFFFGEETFLAHQFVSELTQSLILPDDQDYNLERFNLEDHAWAEIIDLARTIPFLFSSWRVIVVEIPKGKKENLSSSEHKLLESYFSSPPVSQTILIVIYPEKLPRNTSLFKFFSAFPSSVVFMRELKPLKGKALYDWIDKRLQFSKKVASYEAKKRLAELAGNDLRRIGNEIEKIVTFMDEKKVMELDDVNQVSGWVKSFVEWEISDNLAKGDYKQCMIVLNNLLRKEGINPVAILGIVSKFFREIFLAKLWLKERKKDRKAIFKALRPQIHEKFGNFFISKFREFFLLVDKISMEDLNGYLTDLREIDFKLKTTDLSFQTLMEGFLFRYCHKR